MTTHDVRCGRSDTPQWHVISAGASAPALSMNDLVMPGDAMSARQE
jgi:hypothetical protein